MRFKTAPLALAATDLRNKTSSISARRMTSEIALRSAILGRVVGRTHLRSIPLTKGTSKEASFKMPAVAKHRTKKSQHSAHFNLCIPLQRPADMRPSNKERNGHKGSSPQIGQPNLPLLRSSLFRARPTIGILCRCRRRLRDMLPIMPCSLIFNTQCLASFACAQIFLSHSLLYRSRGRRMSTPRTVAIAGLCLQPKLCK